jgi:SAM-dependent methyltransferase
MSDPKGGSPAAASALPSMPGGAARLESDRRAGLHARLARRVRASAEIVVPAVPSLAGHYADMLADHFASLGRPFSHEEIVKMQRLLLEKAIEGFRASPYSNVFVRYHTADDGSLRVDYAIAAATSSLAEEYEHWVKTREPPLFGARPDARLLAALDGLTPGAPCLDVGAGTGRNALPAARRGHEVFAVEAAPALADVLEAAASAEVLAVRVVRADVLAGELPVPRARFALALASQVTSHFRSAGDLRKLFVQLALALAPDGHALLTVFTPRADYRPDRVARELSQVFWSTFFTSDEIAGVVERRPPPLFSPKKPLPFERAHQPAEHWPPTGWYESWAQGQDVFGPMAAQAVSLRWLLLRRTPGNAPEIG